MKKCKYCYHYDACKNMYENYGGVFKTDFDTNILAKYCDYFKDKSNVFELQDNTIIGYEQYKWLVINLESEKLGEAIKRSLDCLTEDVRYVRDIKFTTLDGDVK
jgi:ribosomal protein S17E